MAGSLEANKLIAGVLTAGVIFVGASVLSDLLYHPTELAETAYPVLDDTATDVAEAEPEPEIEPLPVRLASASAADGEGAFRACAACHSVEQGGPHRVGPNLWDVMGAPIAARDDFDYSDTLAGKDGEWTYAKMDAWLENPSEWAPGTSMSYAGIKDPQNRADMIAYLRSLAASPRPLPEPEAAEADGEAAAADGGDATTADASGDAAETATAEAAGSEAAGTGAADEAGGTEAGEAGPAADDAAAPDEAAANEPAAPETTTRAAETAADAGGETRPAAATDAGADTAETDDAPTAAGGGDPLVQRVASASVADGESAFRACSACHTAEQGRPNRVGPNLWNVVGAEIAAKGDFAYSDALAGKQGEWTLANLDAWLADPRAWAAGTSMAYAGIRDPDERAAVIAYLRSLADNPVMLDDVAGGTAARGG